MADERSDPPRAERRLGRAAFLGVIGAGVGTTLYGRQIWGQASKPLGAAQRALPTELQGFVPSLSGWQIYSVSSPMPTFAPATYRLTVSGAVARPLSLDWSEVLALPTVDQVSDFHCVTGWTVKGVRWRGFRLAPLLERAGLSPRATHLEFVSLEHPYADTLTVQQARLSDVLVAHTMDGLPVTRDHGAPLRVVIPQMYGYKGVKWLGGIRALTAKHLGYWETRGYDENAWLGRSNGLGA
jgi:DMSO/TMAO reductase YedYZ molybdopterin-dependent catalytic subunit